MIGYYCKKYFKRKLHKEYHNRHGGDGAYMPKEWVQLKMEERILAKWPDPLSKETKCQTKEIFNNLLRSAEISKERFNYQIQ